MLSVALVHIHCAIQRILPRVALCRVAGVTTQQVRSAGLDCGAGGKPGNSCYDREAYSVFDEMIVVCICIYNV